MEKNKEIKGLIFDFGGVLCRFDNKKFIKNISPYSPFSEDVIDDMIYNRSGLPRKYESGEISSDEFYDDISRLIRLDIPKDIFIDAYTDIFTRTEEMYSLLGRLKKEKYELGLISNTSEWDFNYGFNPKEVYSIFDHVTLSYEVFTMKPDEIIYKESQRKSSYRFDELIYVDDVKKNADKFTSMGGIGIHFITPYILKKEFVDNGIRF